MNQGIDALVHSPQRPTLPRAVWLTFLLATRRLLRGRRLAFLLVILGFPPFICIALKSEGVGFDEGYLAVAPQAYIMLLAPLLSLFHGASVFADEVDDRTIGYLMTRPIPRDALFLGKYAAVTFVSAVMLTFSATAAYFPSVYDGTSQSLGWTPALRDHLALLAVVILDCMTCGALFMFFGLILRHPIIAGIGYLLVVEVAFSLALGPPSSLAISHHASRLLPDAYMTFERFVASQLGGATPLVATHASRTEIVLGMLIATAVFVVVGIAAVRRVDLDGEAAED